MDVSAAASCQARRKARRKRFAAFRATSDARAASATHSLPLARLAHCAASLCSAVPPLAVSTSPSPPSLPRSSQCQFSQRLSLLLRRSANLLRPRRSSALLSDKLKASSLQSLLPHPSGRGRIGCCASSALSRASRSLSFPPHVPSLSTPHMSTCEASVAASCRYLIAEARQRRQSCFKSIASEAVMRQRDRLGGIDRDGKQSSASILILVFCSVPLLSPRSLSALSSQKHSLLQ